MVPPAVLVLAETSPGGNKAGSSQHALAAQDDAAHEATGKDLAFFLTVCMQIAVHGAIAMRCCVIDHLSGCGMVCWIPASREPWQQNSVSESKKPGVEALL